MKPDVVYRHNDRFYAIPLRAKEFYYHLYIVADVSEIDWIPLTYLRTEDSCKSDEISIKVNIKPCINEWLVISTVRHNPVAFVNKLITEWDKVAVAVKYAEDLEYYKMSFPFVFDTAEFLTFDNDPVSVTSLCSHLLQSFEIEQERTV